MFSVLKIMCVINHEHRLNVFKTRECDLSCKPSPFPLNVFTPVTTRQENSITREPPKTGRV